MKVILGGEEREILFGMKAINNLRIDASGVDLSDPLVFSYHVFSAGLKAAAQISGNPVPVMGQVVEWVDDVMINNPEVINEVTVAFTQTQAWRVILEKGKETEEVKKNPSPNLKKRSTKAKGSR